jgi:uncharacterized protein (TIGR03085 family)
MSLAGAERAALADTLDAAGPDRPTLCAGWRTRELLAHLLVRERQLWAAPGIVVPVLAPLTERAMRGYTGSGAPWAEQVDLFRAGPPAWSPYRIAAIDALANDAEFFVHHEDVRRGDPGWAPRPPDPARDDALWTMLGRAGRLLYRRSPVGVVLRRPDGAQQVVLTGRGAVTVVGEAGELLLHAFGRDAVHVEIEGEPADVAAFAGAPRGL